MKTGSSGLHSYYQFDDRIGAFLIWPATLSESELEQPSSYLRVDVLAHLNNFIEFHASAEGVP